MSAAPTLLDLVRAASCRLEESGAWPYLGGWITDDDNRKILVDALSATKEVRWFEGLLVYLTRENLSALRGAADALLRRTSEDARLALSADEVGLAVLLVGIVRQLSENPCCVGSPLLKRVKPCAACGLTMSNVGARGEPLVERGDRPYSPDSTEPASGERLFGMLLLRSMVPPSGEAGWVLWREAACGCMILDHCYIMLHGARASFRDGHPLCPTCGNQIHPYRDSYWVYGVSGTPHELFADAAPSAWDGPAAKGVLDPRDIAVVKQLLPEWMAAEVEDEETEMKSLAEGSGESDEDRPTTAAEAVLAALRDDGDSECVEEYLETRRLKDDLAALTLSAAGRPGKAAAAAAAAALEAAAVEKAFRSAEALLADEEAEKEAEQRAKERKAKKNKNKNKKKKGSGGGSGAGPSQEPQGEEAEAVAAAEGGAVAAAEEAELAAALQKSARLEEERRVAEEQLPQPEAPPREEEPPEPEAPSREEEPPPADFICPITTEVMSDPVMATDGHSYERKQIERWLVTKLTSPMTGEALEHSILTPNHALRGRIREWQEAHH